MAAQLGEWASFGLDGYKQAMLARLLPGDEIKVQVHTYTEKLRKKRTKVIVVTLSGVSREHFFATVPKGGTNLFNWNDALEYRKRDTVAT